MASEEKAIIALNEIAKRYPSGTASLFEGRGIKARANGRNLAKALRKGEITSGQVYDRTIGAAETMAIDKMQSFSDLSGTSPAFTIALDKAKADSTANKGKFNNILDNLLSAGQQAANIYGQFKNNGQPPAPAVINEQSPQGVKPLPWPIIGGAAALVIVLVLVLVFLKKK